MHIPKGNALGVVYQASGIGPAAYGETENQFDITREQTGNIEFGHGPRCCIGAPLARLESRRALASLYQPLPELSLAIDLDDIPYGRCHSDEGIPCCTAVSAGATSSIW